MFTTASAVTCAGSLVEHGAGAAGLLYRRNRYDDPASGRFTQQDPIGLGGGLNVYGFAGGDPVNHSDPFGLCARANGVAQGLASLQCALEEIWGAIKDSPRQLARFGKTAVSNPVASTVVFGALGEAAPAARVSISGSKAAIRAGLGALEIADEVTSGVSRVLTSGSGQAWGVRVLEGGGAAVNRWVKGGDGNTSVLWTYTIDASGKLAGIAKQQYDKAGAVAGSLKHYPLR